MKNSLKFRWILLGLLSIFILSACAEQKEPIKLALSKGHPYDAYQNYHHWIASQDSTIVIDEMYNQTLESALKDLEDCDALLLSGGADIYPDRYGKLNELEQCGSIDFKRDTLEFALIKKALEMEIPIFGICRGQQMINVAMGGSLFTDIPTDIGTEVLHRLPGTYDCNHDIFIEPNTKLGWASGLIKGTTNSNHHQSIDRIAEDLMIAARTGDGSVESIQWKNPEEKAFLMAVQWHPERMDYSHPLSATLAELFVTAIKESVLAKAEDAE